MTLSRNHQTAVFVRRTASDSAAYINRVNGLAGSLNRDPNYSEGGTIKADFYVVNDDTGEITPGTSFTAAPKVDASVVAELEAAGYTVTAPASKGLGGRLSSPYLRRLADEAGYTASLVMDAGEEVVEKPAASFLSRITFVLDEYDDDDDYYDDDDDYDY